MKWDKASVNTRVFPHIPSSIFLDGAAFAPTVGLAVAFWQLRAFLSQMDVPTKESYPMVIVGSDERVAMAPLPLAAAVGPGLLARR